MERKAITLENTQVAILLKKSQRTRKKYKKQNKQGEKRIRPWQIKLSLLGQIF